MEPIRTVGVIGAGTMGLGIAQVCAFHGFHTLLYDADPLQVDRAIKSITGSLQAGVARGKWSADQQQEVLLRIRRATTLDELKADLVIEAAVERLEVKQELFAALEGKNDPHTIFATNTSSLPVAAIGSRLRDPSRCIGLHFFNPADRMKLVEIISGPQTRPEIAATLRAFAQAIGKTAVMAKDSPGFIVNRVARSFYTESLKHVADGAVAIPAVDRLLRASGFKMGPFELMDLIGVDTNLAVTTSVYVGMGRPARFEPNAIQQQLVSEGRLGRKSGRGFYEYAEKVN
jgi:3-hydroxybutyryl-CoA dehydrogenase